MASDSNWAAWKGAMNRSDRRNASDVEGASLQNGQRTPARRVCVIIQRDSAMKKTWKPIIVAVGVLLAGGLWILLSPKAPKDVFRGNRENSVEGLLLERLSGGSEKVEIKFPELVSELNKMLQQKSVPDVGGFRCGAKFIYKNGATDFFEVDISSDAEIFTVWLDDGNPFHDPERISFSTKGFPLVQNALFEYVRMVRENAK
jgi:hypothetical protein